MIAIIKASKCRLYFWERLQLIKAKSYMDSTLINKYNTAVPRYTSYPTVPDWQDQAPAADQWTAHLLESYDAEDGLSLYIHLPFCESLCTYCGCNKRITTNHAVEQPYIKAVLQEWKIYQSLFDDKIRIKELHLGGGTPTFFAPESLQLLIATILADCEIADDHEFSFEAHPNTTTREHIQTLYDLGFRRISAGVQDVTPHILKAINRYQTKEEVANLVNWSREIGYTSVNFDIIYGLPFQVADNIVDTVNFISKYMPDRIAFYSYAHVPWKSASQRAFTIDDVPTGVFKNELYNLGATMLQQLGYHAIGMDHFCLVDEALHVAHNNGSMHRNFMGYTPRYTSCSIALGMSAISDAGTMFVQNEKHVETYQNMLAVGKLPIVKGHELNEDELIMRKAILDLMCRDRVDLTDDLIGLIDPYLNNLDELVLDGLVGYNADAIWVSDKGRYFIRNICAAIDPMYQERKLQNKYSKAI